jgi:hypothetical protein
VNRYYRIVQDKLGRCSAEWRPVWWPFWINCFTINIGTLDEARGVCERHANKVVEYYKPGDYEGGGE